MKDLTIGSLRVRRDAPLIVASLGPDDYADQLKEAVEQEADVIEARLDLFPGIESEEDRIGVGSRLILAHAEYDAPILVTLRGQAERGGFSAPEKQRLEAYDGMLPLCHAIDIELRSTEIRDEVLLRAGCAGRTKIVSYHNFDATPSDSEVQDIVDEMFEVKADIAKVAVMPADQADVDRLAAFTERNAERPIVVIAMGKLGRESRVRFPALGSRLTYGCVGETIAPGQWQIAELRKALDEAL